MSQRCSFASYCGGLKQDSGLGGFGGTGVETQNVESSEGFSWS